MSGNLFIGPGITIAGGITVTVLEYVPEWDGSGDLMSLDGTVDLQSDYGTPIDLNT